MGSGLIRPLMLDLNAKVVALLAEGDFKLPMQRQDHRLASSTRADLHPPARPSVLASPRAASFSPELHLELSGATVLDSVVKD